MTENEVKHVDYTNGLKHLSAARAKLHHVGLSKEEVKVDEDMEVKRKWPSECAGGGSGR
jgi:hypothetical protein